MYNYYACVLYSSQVIYTGLHYFIDMTQISEWPAMLSQRKSIYPSFIVCVMLATTGCLNYALYYSALGFNG